MKSTFVFVIGFLFFICCVFIPFKTKADKGKQQDHLYYSKEINCFDSIVNTKVSSVEIIKDDVCDDTLSKKSNKEIISPKLKLRFISSAMAFPFPLGFVGAHRVMLGTKPYVPFVYVATFGGCFGVIPLIDFLVITFSKNIEQYQNNPNIFMWIK